MHLPGIVGLAPKLSCNVEGCGYTTSRRDNLRRSAPNDLSIERLTTGIGTSLLTMRQTMHVPVVYRTATTIKNQLATQSRNAEHVIGAKGLN